MSDFADIIETIYRHGNYQARGRDAMQSLVEAGETGLDAFLIAREHPPETELHGRDVMETLSDVVSFFAETIPDVVIDRFQAGRLAEFETYWALGSATGDRATDVLISGLKSKEKFSRWAAAESLIRSKNRRAIPALIEALRDRSTDVKSPIVFAMKKRKNLRRPEALPALKKIAASKSIQKHSPGLLKAAEDVIRMIERKS